MTRSSPLNFHKHVITSAQTSRDFCMCKVFRMRDVAPHLRYTCPERGRDWGIWRPRRGYFTSTQGRLWYFRIDCVCHDQADPWLPLNVADLALVQSSCRTSIRVLWYCPECCDSRAIVRWKIHHCARIFDLAAKKIVD